MRFTDQMGREIHMQHWPPRRILSLVPSQTEFLADLGLENEVLGITKFCVHPHSWFQEKQRIGGTKTLDYQKIAALNPDLLIGNKEENDQSQIEYLSQHYPVWMSDIYTLEDALDMMRRVGDLTNKKLSAEKIAGQIEQGFQALKAQTGSYAKAAYLIWRKPFMAAGSDTFIHEMMRHAGFENVFEKSSRYPEISVEQLAKAAPELILLSSEPFPFAAKHIAELQEICPNARVELVDGELFSWYGSRLLHSPEYFMALQQKLRG